AHDDVCDQLSRRRRCINVHVEDNDGPPAALRSFDESAKIDHGPSEPVQLGGHQHVGVALVEHLQCFGKRRTAETLAGVPSVFGLVSQPPAPPSDGVMDLLGLVSETEAGLSLSSGADSRVADGPMTELLAPHDT